MKTPRHILSLVIARELLKKGVSARAFSKEIGAYLLSERRVKELDSILRDVQKDWAEAGYVEVDVVSAHKLNETSKKRISSQARAFYPKAKRIKVSEQVDSSLLGGLRLSIADRQIDLSLVGKINKLNQMIAGEK